LSAYDFDVAIYCPVAGLVAKRPIDEITGEFERLRRHVTFTKVYLETYRSGVLIEEDRMLELKRHFLEQGVKVSGGITWTQGGRRHNPLQGGFDTFCYTSAETRKAIRGIVEFTARLFDEVILDDFFFTSCKCDECRAAKGARSWTEYRLELLRHISEECIVRPARAVNPDISLIIKYPNWYDHYHLTGYNLEYQPKVFDYVYTGTETRDPLYNPQHLQAYMGYFLMRYMENVKPGCNGGGWFDRFNCHGNLNYYVNQVNVTLFSKPREVTLFSANSMVDTIFAPLAGYALEKGCEVIRQLGHPVGVPCYKPYHSHGEDFLYDYIGMLGIPLEPSPRFPEGESMVLLTAGSATDPEIVDKLKGHLAKGHNAVITSGLVSALRDRGIDDLAQIRVTDRRVAVREFSSFGYGLSARGVITAADSIQIPVSEYGTNDSWPLINGLGQDNNAPLLLQTEYGDGALFILAVPDDFGMLYRLPREVLRLLRHILTHGMKVSIDGESKIALFAYDNDAFVIESFLPYDTSVDVIVNREQAALVDLLTERVFEGHKTKEQTRFSVNLPAQTYRAFRVEQARDTGWDAVY
jgi:hypothetical protein